MHRSLRPLVVSLVPGQQRHLLLLKRMRTELSNELADVVNEYGPKLYDDYDQVSEKVAWAVGCDLACSSGAF